MTQPVPADQIAALQDVAAQADRDLLAATADARHQLRYAADTYAWAVAAHIASPLDENLETEMGARKQVLADAEDAYRKTLAAAKGARTKTLKTALGE